MNIIKIINKISDEMFVVKFSSFVIMMIHYFIFHCILLNLSLLFVVVCCFCLFVLTMYSYTLSKQLEPDDSPNNHMLTVPDSSSLTPLSPSKIRKHIRQLFSVKSSTVADFSPGTITTSVSERDISSSIEESPVRNRSCSLSPSTSRKASVSEDMPDGISSHLDDSGQLEANGHGVSSQLTDGRVVVRVASANSEHCNYKSLWVSEESMTVMIRP